MILYKLINYLYKCYYLCKVILAMLSAIRLNPGVNRTCYSLILQMLSLPTRILYSYLFEIVYEMSLE